MKIAIGILLVFYLFYWIKLRKRYSKSDSVNFEHEDESEIANLTAPFRSAKEYREATNNLKNTFSTHSMKPKKGRTIISQFSGPSQYIWDGEYLSRYGGAKILKFDGKYISSFSGSKQYTWENNCLSVFAGKKLYSVSNNTISTFSGPSIYRFDKTSISVFSGPKIYSIKGDIDVPEAIIIVIAENIV